MPPLGAPSDVATRLTGLSDGHQNERALREMAALLRCDGSDLVDGEWSAFIWASSWSGGLIMVFLKKKTHHYTCVTHSSVRFYLQWFACCRQGVTF